MKCSFKSVNCDSLIRSEINSCRCIFIYFNYHQLHIFEEMLKNVIFSLLTFLLLVGNSSAQLRHVPEHHFNPRERSEEFTRMLHRHTGQRYSDPLLDYQDYGINVQHRSKDNSRDWIPVSENEESLASASQLSETNIGINSDRDSSFEVVPNWPAKTTLGQISAVSIDMDGNVVVFHRGSRVWNSESFEINNTFAQIDKGPILENTVVVFNSTTGQVIREWGSEMFYMPHGLTVDHENNIWITDVALHQVFKFSHTGKKEAVLTLGTAFIPGSDDKHFCKPTDVAIMSDTDEFFVSDGYCNSRIIKYTKEGEHLLTWGRSVTPEYPAKARSFPNFFSIPHALALAEDKKLLCVADRENGRVQCFNCHTGLFVMQVHSEEMGSRIFSVAYSPAGGGFLYVVNGPEFRNDKPVSGYVINMETQKPIEQFMPDGKQFSSPHDIAVSTGGRELYVVELKPFNIWKFMKGSGDDPSLRAPVNRSNIPVTASLLLQKESPEKIQSNSNTANTSIDIGKHDSNTEESSPENNRQESGATAIGIVIGASAVVAVVILIALIRMRKRGCSGYGYMNHSDKWEFPISPVDGFKISQFLDRHQGFEKVRTEESDDEGSSGSSAELGTTVNQFA